MDHITKNFNRESEFQYCMSVCWFISDFQYFCLQECVSPNSEKEERIRRVKSCVM